MRAKTEAISSRCKKRKENILSAAENYCDYANSFFLLHHSNVCCMSTPHSNTK